MCISVLRIALNGWISAQYLESKIYFTYYGFSWIKPLPEPIIYLCFGLMFIASLGILLGLFYRISTITFFLLFTYTELIDKTYYLNHYYFVSLVSFLMIIIPAHKRLSLDLKFRWTTPVYTEPQWYILILKIQVGIVYFYAGIAKINYDWLLRAMPLKIWLAANVNKPIVGQFFGNKITPFIFSWTGMLYDISIPFFLLMKKSRIIAFCGVIVFHLLTSWLFPIGIFPFVMILSALIFFSEEWHERIIGTFETWLGFISHENTITTKGFIPKWKIIILSTFIFFQLTFPLRYLFYPDNVFWTEEGYRFSWRVMLMEKMGNATFYVTDMETGKKNLVYNREHLSLIQEKMMSSQPDMIIQYAKFLKKVWIGKGITNPKVTADIYVTLNGERSERFIDPDIDLSVLDDTWAHKTWILEKY